MEEPVCSIEIVENEDKFKAKVQSELGRYFEYENEDLENLMETVYEDLQMEIDETYTEDIEF